nr:MAG TPA: apocytochrome F [Caudoviricetes sp.]
MCPSSTGGSGGDTLTSSIQINGNGDVELGTITISPEGFTWAPKDAA